MPKDSFTVLIAVVMKVNRTFCSIYPFYNSATGKAVAVALRALASNICKDNLMNPLSRFAVVGKADFLLPSLPPNTVFCDKCKDNYLPLPQEGFSHVFAFDFFQDRQDEKHFVQELHRITEKDGKVIFFAVRKNSFWTYDDTMPFKNNVQYTDRELKMLFTEAGFSNLSFGKSLLLPPAIYKEDFAAKEQKFRFVLGWLAGITAVYAEKTTLAAVPVATARERFIFGKKKKAPESQTALTSENDGIT